MNKTEVLEQYLEAMAFAEDRITDYENFSKKYNLKDKDYFIDKLLVLGYSEYEASLMTSNKDLMLALYINGFNVQEEIVEEQSEFNIVLEEARQAYMNAVDNANLSIKAANEAKEIILSLKELIENKFGTDSNSWDNGSVKEYNDAVILYNRLVEKANQDTMASKDARQHLAEVRNSIYTGIVVDVTLDSENNNMLNNDVVEIN